MNAPLEQAPEERPSGLPLDLREHGPEDLDGRVLHLGGADYIVGARLAGDDQGIAHRLVNRAAGISHHVLYLPAGYREDAPGALARLRSEVAENLALRAHMLGAGDRGAAALPISTVHVIDGIGMELRETAPLPEPGDPAMGILVHVGELRKKGNLAMAAVHLRDLLAALPRHTAALELLAQCLDATGDHAGACTTLQRAIAVEPNLAAFRGRLMRFALRAHMPRLALQTLEYVHACHPGVIDWNGLGVQAALACGEPHLAADILQRTPLAGPRRREVQDLVDTAARALAAAGALRDAAGPVPSLELLEQMHGLYPQEPLTAANLAFALRDAGQYERAAGLLLVAAGAVPVQWAAHCHANAAICLALTGDWELALDQFERSAVALALESGEPPGLLLTIGEREGAREGEFAVAAAVVAAIMDSAAGANASAAARILARRYGWGRSAYAALT